MLIISGKTWRRCCAPPFCFNLAIEMLIISGIGFVIGRQRRSEFQSRNRDAYHFRSSCHHPSPSHKFQSRNRDACHFRFGSFGRYMFRIPYINVSISQSRFLSFQALPAQLEKVSGVGSFQSRNRDSCHFRVVGYNASGLTSVRFNLAIEILVISGSLTSPESREPCLRFNLAIEMLIISGYSVSTEASAFGFNLAIEMLIISGRNLQSTASKPRAVSISQSRCLSFQVHEECNCTLGTNRRVSISQSRCLSFQARAAAISRSSKASFNLAIEMLIISGEDLTMSMHRDTCFNLAIEMLIISGNHTFAS